MALRKENPPLDACGGYFPGFAPTTRRFQFASSFKQLRPTGHAVENDTVVDFARLRIRRCPPFILDGHAVLLTNAVAVAVPVGWVIASDPTLPVATNLTAVFELGDTPEYSGTELRIQTDTYGQTVQALSGDRVEVVRALRGEIRDAVEHVPTRFMERIPRPRLVP